jgi:hypothetical protein
MLISIIITLILIGILLYVLDLVVPMDAKVRKIIHIIVLVVVVIWLLQVFGIWNGSLPNFVQTSISTTVV